MRYKLFETANGSVYWATPAEKDTLRVRRMHPDDRYYGVCYGTISEGQRVRFWSPEGRPVDTSEVVRVEENIL